MKITPAQIMAAEPCTGYSLERVTSLWAGRDALTPAEIGTLDIPVEDRLWAIIYCVLTDRQCRLLACDYAERVLQRKRDAGCKPDPRGWKAIEVARQYAVGNATQEELTAAWTSADTETWLKGKWTAGDVTWDIAQDAAWYAAGADAGEAAREAARETAWEAAREAARKWQLARALEYAKEKENNHE